MSREAQFLVATLRRFLVGGAPCERAAVDLDWPALLRLAQAHAVTPMLYSALRDVPAPQEFAQQLRSSYETSALKSLTQSGELTRLAEKFEEHRIAFVALKGPLLSQYLYGALGARTSGDIDVLVKMEDVPRIRNILVSSGYRLSSALHWNSDSACVRSREAEISFQSAAEVSIDVHWRLMPHYSASVFDHLSGWESLRPVLLAGHEIQTLAPEPLLLFLCAHAAKHMFERLGWICDIARFLHVTPNLDWARIIEQSRHARSLRQLLLSLHLANDLLGAPIPNMDKDAEVARLTHMVTDRLMAGATPPVPALASNRYTLRLLETPAQRLRYLAGLYLTPSEAEYRALKLPPSLFFLYYPFRPLRLIWKYVRNSPASSDEN